MRVRHSAGTIYIGACCVSNMAFMILNIDQHPGKNVIVSLL